MKEREKRNTHLGFLECLLRAAAGSDAPSAAPAELDPPFGSIFSQRKRSKMFFLECKILII